MTWIEIAIIASIVLILGLLGAGLYDEASAKPERIEHCTLLEKHHEQAWDEVHSDGKTVWTEHHPECWWFVVTPRNYVSVREEQYKSYRESQPVDVMLSIGGLGGEHRKIAPPMEQ